MLRSQPGGVVTFDGAPDGVSSPDYLVQMTCHKIPCATQLHQGKHATINAPALWVQPKPALGASAALGWRGAWLSVLKFSTKPLLCHGILSGMRKFILPGFVVAGAVLGLLSAAHEDWGTRVIMMGVGVLLAAPIGAALGRIRLRTVRGGWPDDLASEGTTTSRGLVKNYWRDRGHPPFMKPSDGEPDQHMFDPHRLG